MDWTYKLIRKAVLNLVRGTFLALIDAAALIRHAVRGAAGGISGKKRLLVVRVDRIGDFVLWLDAARGLRMLYPSKGWEMTLLCNGMLSEFAAGCGLFDNVWPLDKEQYREAPYHFGLLARLRMARFDLAIQPTYSRDYIGDSLMLFCGAPVKIASAGDTSNIDADRKKENDRRYTRLVPAGRQPMMEIVRNAEFVRGLGLAGFEAGMPRLRINPCALDLPGDYYVVFPGASAPMKKWPLSNFVEMTAKIHRKTGWKAIVCGTFEEKWAGDAIGARSGAPVINLAGRTTIAELAAVIKGGRMLICNDTSVVHIAAAVSTPSVCMLGGGHYGRFLPYSLETPTDSPLPVQVSLGLDCFGCNWRCRHYVPEGEPVPCITGITVDMAWDAVEKILEREAGWTAAARP